MHRKFATSSSEKRREELRRKVTAERQREREERQRNTAAGLCRRQGGRTKRTARTGGEGKRQREGKLHFNLIGRRNSKLSQGKRRQSPVALCNRMIEPALSQLSANGPGVLDKKERESPGSPAKQAGLNAPGAPAASRRLFSIE